MKSILGSWRTASLGDVVYHAASAGIFLGAAWIAWHFFAGPWLLPAPPPGFAFRKVPLAIDGSPSIGSATATAVVVEFSDFQCPVCRDFAVNLQPELKRLFVDSGQIRWIFKNYPLTSVHPDALGAAEVARCAHEQRLFWQAHDSFFRTQDLTRAHLAESMRPSMPHEDRFDACLASEDSAVRSDIQDAWAVGVSGTPSFLLGSISPSGSFETLSSIQGVGSPQSFKAALKKLVSTTVPR